jgi:hypothetical protein
LARFGRICHRQADHRGRCAVLHSSAHPVPQWSTGARRRRGLCACFHRTHRRCGRVRDVFRRHGRRAERLLDNRRRHRGCLQLEGRSAERNSAPARRRISGHHHPESRRTDSRRRTLVVRARRPCRGLRRCVPQSVPRCVLGDRRCRRLFSHSCRRLSHGFACRGDPGERSRSKGGEH